MKDNLDPELIKILSFHGPVELWVGPESDRRAATAAIAPFEDVVYALIPRGSGFEKALHHSCRGLLTARAPDRSYTLKLLGRVHADRPLTTHPQRGQIVPWLPEGMNANQLVVAPFVPEEIELVTVADDTSQRRAGTTPAKEERLEWWKLAGLMGFGGLAAPFALLVMGASWGWLAIEGREYPLRPVALLLSVMGGLGALAATRLLTLVWGFLRWRDGKAVKGDAPYLSEGLLAPWQARGFAMALAALAMCCWGLLALLWEPNILKVSMGTSGFWLLGPVWAAHLLAGKSGQKRG